MRPIDADKIVYYESIDADTLAGTGKFYAPRELIDAMPTIEPQRWILCSERLPEHSERYLVTAFDGTDRRTTVVPYQPRNGTWALTGRMSYWKVLAWMPLPEPYKEKQG